MGFPPITRHQVFEADGWTCRNCGSRKALTIDHIVPRARGGTGARENLQTLCKHCNGEKGCSYPGDLPIVPKRPKKRKPWEPPDHTAASRRSRERFMQCPRCRGTGVPYDVPVGRTQCEMCRNSGRVLMLRRGNNWVQAPLGVS